MRRISLLLITLLAITVSGTATAEGVDGNIFRVREGFIYNFLKFVVWPQSYPLANANICITGDPAFAEDYMAKQVSKMNDMQIHVRELTDYSSIPSCHVLFIGKEAEDNLDAILSRVRHKPVLTISEIKGFADQGGIIEIATANMQVGLFSKDKTNLRINLKAARDDDLNIDARLLQIAAEIIK